MFAPLLATLAVLAQLPAPAPAPAVTPTPTVHVPALEAAKLALHEAMLAAGMESPYGEWLKRWDTFERKERTLTTHVPCADFFEVRDKALLAHATQIDPDGGWFRVPMEIQQEVWPTEDFELATSLVETSLPESDLFAGIRQN